MEIGISSGYTFNTLKEHVANYSSTDISNVIISRYQKEYKNNKKFNFYNMYAHEIFKLKEKFDVIILNSVAPLFPNEEYFYIVINQLLQKIDVGGKIYLGDMIDEDNEHSKYLKVDYCKLEEFCEMLGARLSRCINIKKDDNVSDEVYQRMDYMIEKMEIKNSSNLLFKKLFLQEDREYCINIIKHYNDNILKENIYQNKVQGLFLKSIKKLGIENLLSKDMNRNFELEEKKLKKKAEIQIEMIKKISEELKVNEINHFFVKGLINSYDLYETYLRCGNDIDLFIKNNNLDEVDNMLKNLGFIKGKYDQEEKIIIPYEKEEKLFRKMYLHEYENYYYPTNNDLVPFIKLDLQHSISKMNLEQEYVDMKPFFDNVEEKKYNTISNKIELVTLNKHYNLLFNIYHFNTDNFNTYVPYKKNTFLEIIDIHKMLNSVDKSSYLKYLEYYSYDWKKGLL